MHSRPTENRVSPEPGFFPWHFSKNCCQEGSPLGALAWLSRFLYPDSCHSGLDHRDLAERRAFLFGELLSSSVAGKFSGSGGSDLTLATPWVPEPSFLMEKGVRSCGLGATRLG